MNRKYGTARYLESVDLLRKHFQKPGPAITTDLIVGFPGETEEEFAQTLDFIRQCAFSAMHIFPGILRHDSGEGFRHSPAPFLSGVLLSLYRA